MKTVLGCHPQPSQTIRRRIDKLDPFANLWNDMRNLLIEKSNTELRRLIQAAEETTDTNCWFAAFEVSPIVKEMAEAILAQRAVQKARKKNHRK